MLPSRTICLDRIPVSFLPPLCRSGMEEEIFGRGRGARHGDKPPDGLFEFHKSQQETRRDPQASLVALLAGPSLSGLLVHRQEASSLDSCDRKEIFVI